MAGAIRQQIDVASLERYVEANVPAISLPIEVKQFGYGQSNPTYQLTDSKGARFVMRKKPPGKLLSKTAHKVDREYRIIHALEKTEVPVPKTFCLCEDEAVVGTAFYVMEFLDGRIFEDPMLPDVSEEDRREMWQDAVRTLAKFHNVKPASVGLESFGKPSGFYNRQLATFSTICEAQASAKDMDTGEPVGKIPYFDEMVAFFKDPKTQPKDRSTLVHGDYKIDNLVFHKTEPRVIGILDWEMSTIGHPLSDLANLLMPYITATSSLAAAAGRAYKDFAPGQTPGLPTREELLRLYASHAGWDPLPDARWADAFSIFRGAIIMQGIAARYALRQASSARAKEYADMMPGYGLFGWETVQKCKEESAEKARL